jgi:hypothetical protein
VQAGSYVAGELEVGVARLPSAGAQTPDQGQGD